jgi:ABC-2 type transport system ATP-binding protein
MGVAKPDWFVRRRIGVGVRPATWQGWLISLIAAAAAITGYVTFKKTAGDVAIVCVAVVYLLVALASGGTKRAKVRPGVVDDSNAPVDQADVAVTHADTPTFDSQSAREIAESIVTQSGRFAGQSEAGCTSSDAVIVVDHLTKQFGDRVAFRDVSFSVNRGEVFGFLGPNGAGKTSTVRTLSTLVTPTSGTASVAGIELTQRNGFEIRQRIAVMTELPGLYLRLSVMENLEFFAGLYGFRDAQARIDRALEAVNLTSRANDLSGSLSKGLRQRVGLARALLNDPEIIFLDEPTAGLDPVASLEVHDLINALRAKGVTVFLTTHRLDEAEKLCDRVAILNTTLRTVGRIDDLRQRMFRKGIVVTTATPLSDPDAVFNSVVSVESWTSDAGNYVITVNDVRAAAPDVTRALVSAGADVLSIVESRHSLEEVYLELVGATQKEGDQ